MHNYTSLIKQSKVIAAVKNDQQLDLALKSNAKVIFILSGNIFDIASQVLRVVNSGKLVFIHIDFIEGLSSDQTAILYIQKVVKPHGIISTKAFAVKYAISIGLFAIQRFFLIDSMSYATMKKTIQSVKPDIVEIMPGLIPSIVSSIINELGVSVIASGLIQTEDVVKANLSVGAIAVSTSSDIIWNYK